MGRPKIQYYAGKQNGTTDYRRQSSQLSDDKPASTSPVRPVSGAKPAPTNSVTHTSPRSRNPAGFDGSSRRPKMQYYAGKQNGTIDYRRQSSQLSDDKPSSTSPVSPASGAEPAPTDSVRPVLDAKPAPTDSVSPVLD